MSQKNNSSNKEHSTNNNPPLLLISSKHPRGVQGIMQLDKSPLAKLPALLPCNLYSTIVY